MTDWKQALMEHAPFLLATAGGGQNKLNLTRVLESLIIAGITGGIVLYGVTRQLETQMLEYRARTTQQMQEIKERLAEVHQESLVRDQRQDDRINDMARARVWK